MKIFRKKPLIVNAKRLDELTSDELTQYGICCGANMTGGAPNNVAHQDEECSLFLVPTISGRELLEGSDMLVIKDNGDVHPCKLDVFEKTHEQVEE